MRRMILAGRLLIDPHEVPAPGWLAIEMDRIVEIGGGAPPEKQEAGGPDAIICPGFIDAHLHLPQFDSIGCDGLTLLDWLDRIIFPAEARWSDEAFAEGQARAAYARLLRAGTLGFAGFLSSHFNGWAAAVRAGHERPLRAIVGQSLMDRNAPAELLGQRIARLARSERGRLVASVNPRFAIACSDEMLREAGERARAGGNAAGTSGGGGAGAFIQTHLAESIDECALVRELFPDDPHYTGVYDRHGLLTERTLLAHCVHLSNDQWKLIEARRSVVVHCPGANTFLKSGVFDLRAAREHNVRLALGSDIAAGPDIAMPRVARAMIEVDRLREMLTGRPQPIPTPADAWSLITRGNADALGWDDGGRIEIGAAADLLILRPPFEVDEHLIGRLIYTWRNAYLEKRVLAGRMIE